MTTTANLKAVTVTAHGMTEELARTFFDKKGKHGLAIISFRSTRRSDGIDDKDIVSLEVLEFEPVDDLAIDHVRELMRAHAMNRKLHSETEQLTLDQAGDVEPKVEDVMAKGIQFTPHTYIQEIDGPNCNICGADEDAVLHRGEPDDPEDYEDVDDYRDHEELPQDDLFQEPAAELEEATN